MHRLLISIVFAVLLIACGSDDKLKPLASDGVILAFGDSLTFGTGAPPSASYPLVLEQLSQRRLVNRGIAGEQTPQGLQRLPAEFIDKTAEITQVAYQRGLLSGLQKDKSIKSDGVHFNAQGYALLAEGIFDSLHEFGACNYCTQEIKSTR